ncbi:Protein of unknown function [Leuconostoc citreum LBAE C11]|nr:Protein of unknown function [Leuconostoc citreum LBAE C11]
MFDLRAILTIHG